MVGSNGICGKCKHNNVCMFKRKVEKGEKYIINQIHNEATLLDDDNKENKENNIIALLKIGVVDCQYFGKKENK